MTTSTSTSTVTATATTTAASPKPLRIAIAGLGAIGKSLARTLAAGSIPGVTLSAVSAKNLDRAREFVETLPVKAAVLAIADLEPNADVVVECAPGALLPQIVTPFLKARKHAIVLSVGALLSHPDLIELARATGGTLLVPTGALIGLDAVIAAAEGTIHSVTMVTRKPPNGLVGAPYLVENHIEVDGLTEPKRVFKGNAREAVDGNGRITLDVEVTRSEPVARLEISVADNGRGMTEEYVRTRLFRPFATTKTNGLGIGLAQCRAIVEAHGGRIDVRSRPGEGTTFVVSVPAAPGGGLATGGEQA